MGTTEMNEMTDTMENRFFRTGKGKVTVLVLLFLLLAAVLLFIFGGKKGYRTISISELFGSVMAEDNGSEFEAYPDMHLREGHALNTYQESYARMALDDDKYVKLEENSRAEFVRLAHPAAVTQLSIWKGVRSQMSLPDRLAGTRAMWSIRQMRFLRSGEPFSVWK